MCRNPLASIIIWDKERDSRVLLQRLLESNGHTVVCVESRKELFDFVHDIHLDLVILTNGFKESGEVASHLKEIDRNIKVMTITNCSRSDPEPSIIDDYLIKPIDLEAIESKVHELLT
jgi:DNA-binding response OmpR family regulator